MADTTLKLILLGEDKGASSALANLGKTAGVALAAAGAAALKFGADSLAAFAEADAEQKKLEDAYRRFPALADGNIDSLRGLNEAIQRKVGADADDIAGAQAVLAQYELNEDQLRRITPLMVDYATKTGKDMPTAAGLLGKALMGNARAMKDLGIDFKATGDRAADLDTLIGNLDEKVGGYAESIPDAERKQKILAASFGDLQESIGEKLQPVLLDLIDTGQDVVEWATDNADALITVGKVAATAAGGIVLAVGAFKASRAISEATAAIKGAATAFTTLTAKSKAAAIGVGAATLALSVGASIVAAYMVEKQRAEQAVADFTEAIQADTGALGENTAAAVGNQLASQGLTAAAAKMGISAEALTDAVMGNADALAFAEQKMAEYMAANADNEGAITGAKIETDGLSDALGTMSGQVRAAQSAYSEYKGAVRASTTATQENTDAAQENADAQRDAAAALMEVYRNQLALRGDTRALEAAYDDATDSIKKNGKTLDTNTDAGRKNQAALDSIASTALSVKEGMEKAGRSTSSVDKQMDSARKEFIKTAKQMGLSSDEAKKLADKLGLIKSKKVTVTAHITTTGAKGIKATYTTSGGVKFSAYAKGGRPKVGEPAMFHSDELWVPDTAGTVLTKSQTKRLLDAGGPVPLSRAAAPGAAAPASVSITFVDDQLGSGRKLYDLLRNYSRAQGGRGLVFS